MVQTVGQEQIQSSLTCVWKYAQAEKRGARHGERRPYSKLRYRYFYASRGVRLLKSGVLASFGGLCERRLFEQKALGLPRDEYLQQPKLYSFQKLRDPLAYDS